MKVDLRTGMNLKEVVEIIQLMINTNSIYRFVLTVQLLLMFLLKKFLQEIQWYVNN